MNTDTLTETEKYWTEHVESWQQTDLTQAAYCQKHELLVHRFGYWKRKLAEPDQHLPEVQGFVQLRSMPSINSSLSLQLPNQLRIEGIASDNLYLVKQLTEILQ
ncbi:MAG: hypothetical protein HOE78_11005 [Gammaproteobacteria bacterium]|nr:hypothetical protein [Gammaproteobacteria bacterium]